jgi:hypothetical protein
MTVRLDNIYSYKTVQDRKPLKQHEYEIRVNTSNSQMIQKVAGSIDFCGQVRPACK